MAWFRGGARTTLVALFAFLAIGVGLDRATAANVESVTAPPATQTYYGDWEDIRLTFAVTQSSVGSVTWEVVSGLPQGVNSTFSAGTTANLDLTQVGRGPDAGTYTVTVRARGADGSEQTASVDLTILPRPVRIGGSFTVDGKTYGDTPGATILTNNLTLESQVTDGLVGRGVIPLDASLMTLNAVAAFDSENAGTAVANLSGSTLTGFDGARDLSQNYELLVTASSGYSPPTASATIVPKPIALDPARLTFQKTYDGTTAITPTGTPAVDPGGLVNGDSPPAVSGSPTWTLTSAGAGESKPVSITSGQYSLSDPNYTLSTTSLTTALVDKAMLEVQFSVNTKEYDGTNTLDSASVTIDTLNGLAESDSSVEAIFSSATLGGTAPGSHAVTLNGLTLTPESALDNYILSQEAQTGAIDPKQLTLEGSFEAQDKDYDATTVATLLTSSLTLSGVIETEDVDVDPSSIGLQFSQSSAGTNLTVTITTIGLTGDDATNYSVSLPSAITDTADINPLLIDFGNIPGPKTYDGTRAAQVTCSPTNIPLDETATVAIDCSNAEFDSPDYTGTPTTITVTPAITVDGVPLAGSGNYRFPTSPDPYTFTTTQIIQKKSITITGLAATARAYDGTTVIVPAEAIPGTRPGLEGVIETDIEAVSLDETAGTMSVDSANASATPQSVTVSGYALSGDRAGNYTLEQPTSLTVTISPREVNVTVTGVDKVYDSSLNLPSGWSCGLSPVDGEPLSGSVSVSCGSGAYLSNEHVGLRDIQINYVYVSDQNFEAQNIVIRQVGEDPAVPTVRATGQISQRPLTISNGTMQYNGLTSETATYSTNKVGNDDFTVTAATNFASSAVGATGSPTVSTFSVSGSDVENYSFSSAVSDQTARIIARTLTITGFVTSTKPYDGTKSATVNTGGIDLSGREEKRDANGDVLRDGGGQILYEDVFIRPASEGAWPTFTFRSRHVGTNIRLDRSGSFVLAGADSANYTLTQPNGDNNSGLRASITPIPLAVSGSFTTSSKTYDGSTAATIGANNLSLTGKAAGSEYTLTLGTPTIEFASANAGSNIVVSIASVDFTVSGITDGSSASTIKDNYTFTFSGVTDPDGEITQAPLSISGATATNRAYNGTTTISPGGSPTLVGLVPGDTDYVALNSSGVTMTVSEPDYSATPKAVTVTGYALTAGTAGDRTGNYSLSQPAGITVSISQAPLTISGATATNRAYDGTLVITPGGSPTLVGVVAGDANFVALDASGATMVITGTNPNYQATPKGVTATGYALTAGTAGDRTGNYSLSQPTGVTVSISKAPLPVAVSAARKTYDGTRSVALTATINSDDLFSRDRPSGATTYVTATASGLFDDEDVTTIGDGSVPVTVSSVTLGGTSALNYSPTFTATTSAIIDPFTLTLTPRADNKTYDGTATVMTDGQPGAVCSFAKPVGASADKVTVDCSDALFISGGGFAAEDVAFSGSGSNAVELNKTVTISNISLGGDDRGNYSLSSTSGTAQAKILRAGLTLSNLDPQDKYYDGDRFATYDDSAATLLDAQGNAVSALTFSGLQGTFAVKNPGEHFVRLSAWVLTGTGATNYKIDIDATQKKANIFARPLVISVSAADKDYDGGTSVSLNEMVTGANLGGTASTTGVIGGERITLAASGAFVDRNAGESVDVAVSGVTLGGADSGNYLIHSFTTSTTARIFPIALNWTVNGKDKDYDGTRDAFLTAGDIDDDRLPIDSGLSVSFTGATFDTANAGTGKSITVTGLSISGEGSGNYTYSSSAEGEADIRRAVVAVTGTFTASPKVYDGTLVATGLNTSGLTFSGLVGSDATAAKVNTATAEFLTKTVGTGKTVVLKTLTLKDIVTSNYTIDLSGVTNYTSGVITPLSLTPTMTVQDRLWNGGTSATITSITVAGKITGDEVLVNTGVAVAQFRSATQGNGKTVDVTNIRLTGADAGNYILDLTETATGVYSGTTTASITGTPITISITASDKVYDGTRTATITVSDDAAVSDDVTVTVASVLFATRDVGTSITVTATGFSLSGADADKYVIANLSATDTADITAKSLTLVATSKVYDGNPTAQVALSGVESGDTVTFTSTGATFSDKNVGTGKTVTATGLALSGTHVGNYSISSTTTTTANITPRTLTVTFTPNPPVSDVASNITVDRTDNRITDDVLTITITDASAVRRGNQLFLVVTGITLGGTDSGNYVTQATYEILLRTFPTPSTPSSSRPPATNPEILTSPLAPTNPTTNTGQNSARPGQQDTGGATTGGTTPGGTGSSSSGTQSGNTPPSRGRTVDILPGWRPGSGPEATIDFGEGVLTREGQPRDLADRIIAQDPDVIRQNQFPGFAPNTTTQVEIMGARTITQLIVSPDNPLTPERLRDAFGQVSQTLGTEGPRVVQVTNPSGYAVPTPEELNLLQDALAWLGLPEATSGPGLSDGRAVVEVVWQVEGYRPGSIVFLIATSEPSLMAWGIADDEGRATLQGTVLDTSLAEGDHRFRVVGTAVVGQLATAVDGSVALGEGLNNYLDMFDEDTRITLALWGDNDKGADHVVVRYIDPQLADDTGLWWWLLVPGLAWLLLVLWRRRRGDWTNPTGRVTTATTGVVLATPAIVVGVVLSQTPLIPAGIALGAVLFLVAAFVPPGQIGTRNPRHAIPAHP